jgi:hypothetical protein
VFFGEDLSGLQDIAVDAKVNRAGSHNYKSCTEQQTVSKTGINQIIRTKRDIDKPNQSVR